MEQPPLVSEAPAQTGRGVWGEILAALGCGLLAVGACVAVAVVAVVAFGIYLLEFAGNPGGPGYEQLAATPVFVETMPGAREQSHHGADPRGGMDGAGPGYAIRVLDADADPRAVIAWHASLFVSDGWTSVADSAIDNDSVGYHEWRKGDLELTLSNPLTSSADQPASAYPGGTRYQLTLKWHPLPSGTPLP
jgi:hypothetical protein